jgi:hypothetical protein
MREGMVEGQGARQRWLEPPANLVPRMEKVPEKELDLLHLCGSRVKWRANPPRIQL